MFADIEPDDFCLDPAAVEAAITERTKAIMPVHLYGHPADMDALGAIAERHGLMLFEDAAQAHGATLDGAPVGTFGTFAMFSLYPTKNMTSGEGGMVACDDDGSSAPVRLLRNQGMERQYANEVIGLNNRMTDIHAAIGRVQLTKVGGWTADPAAERRVPRRAPARRRRARRSPRCRRTSTTSTRSASPRTATGSSAALREEYGVGSGVYYPIPNHRLRVACAVRPGLDLPETERAAAEVLSLPVHPSLERRTTSTASSTAVNTVARAGA